tara:strand:- start:122 stop:418 length:297 start_codon:yes stop_codon:yes gene_type:complete
MTITNTIDEYSFRNGFLIRDDCKNNFSYDGLKHLYDYLWEFSEDIGEVIEYDPVAFCCEYSEYENIQEVYDNYQDVDFDLIHDHIIFRNEKLILIRQF